ncbi:hypothetical protein DIPPA_13938 [Diplonema papillatum]|nr:hypothetical protein DIPPA_13938 [Diplonema papillatum]
MATGKRRASQEKTGILVPLTQKTVGLPSPTRHISWDRNVSPGDEPHPKLVDPPPPPRGSDSEDDDLSASGSFDEETVACVQQIKQPPSTTKRRK